MYINGITLQFLYFFPTLLKMNFYVLGSYPCWFTEIRSLGLVRYILEHAYCIFYLSIAKLPTIFYKISCYGFMIFSVILLSSQVHTYSILTNPARMAIPVYTLSSIAWKLPHDLMPLILWSFDFYHLEVNKVMSPCFNLHFSGY